MNTPCEIAEKETASLVDPNDKNLTWVFTIKDLSLLYGVTAIEIPLCEWNPNWFKHGLNKKLPTTSSCIHKTLPCFLTCDTPGTHQVFPKPFRNFQVVFFLLLRIWHGQKIQGMRPRAFDTCLGRTSCSYRGMAPLLRGGGNELAGWMILLFLLNLSK